MDKVHIPLLCNAVCVAYTLVPERLHLNRRVALQRNWPTSQALKRRSKQTQFLPEAPQTLSKTPRSSQRSHHNTPICRVLRLPWMGRVSAVVPMSQIGSSGRSLAALVSLWSKSCQVFSKPPRSWSNSPGFGRTHPKLDRSNPGTVPHLPEGVRRLVEGAQLIGRNRSELRCGGFGCGRRSLREICSATTTLDILTRPGAVIVGGSRTWCMARRCLVAPAATP